MLFAPGARPDAAAIATALEESGRGWISAAPDRAGDWLELLIDGLTFDLLGLAPGPSLVVPDIRHRFEFEGEPAGFEAIGFAPGPHLAAARAALPVVRAMALLAREFSLSDAVSACGALWQPAGSAMGRRYFERVVGNWATGGPFPALGLIGVEHVAPDSLRSDGLSFFTGQEIVFRGVAREERAASTRLLVRLIDSFVAGEPLNSAQDFLGDDGIGYRVRPVPGTATIEVKKRGGD